MEPPDPTFNSPFLQALRAVGCNLQTPFPLLHAALQTNDDEQDQVDSVLHDSCPTLGSNNL